MTAANVLWLPLGELLVERRLLSNVQLELALAEQRRTGLRLGEVLVSMGFVSEEALARMLLEQVGLSTTAEEPTDVHEERVAEPASEAQPEEPVAEAPPPPDLEPGVAVVWERREEPAAPEPPAEPQPEMEPQPETEQTPVPEPEPELRVAVEPQPEPAPSPEPIIVRMDDPERERGRWWSRNGNKSRIRELEKVLSDFEQRSRAIEADIMRVRTTLRSLRDAKPS